jgi:hypothetical protein
MKDEMKDNAMNYNQFSNFLPRGVNYAKYEMKIIIKNKTMKSEKNEMTMKSKWGD